MLGGYGVRVSRACVCRRRRPLLAPSSGAPTAPSAAGAATAAAASADPFRTDVADPSQHSAQQLGKLYTVDPEHHKRLFQVRGLRKPLAEQASTFCELALLVRAPALHLLQCLRALPADRPTVRFCLYGHYGAGKATTMAHVLHWATVQGWVTVHLPELDQWGLRFRSYEVNPSATDPMVIEHPNDVASWLTHFKQQNSVSLPALALTTQQEYTWSRREVTPLGAPLADVVELGITRMKHAPRVMHVLMHELKQHATAQRCRVLVAIEKVNAIWGLTKMKREDQTRIPFTDLLAIRSVQQLLGADWRGGAVVASVAPVPSHAGDRPHRPAAEQADSDHRAHLPRHLLTEPGWRALDPFVPIRVDDMSRSEVYSMIDYMCERRWLQPISASEEAKKELFFRCGGNPGKLVEICRQL